MFGVQPLLAPGAVRHLGGHLQAGFIQTGIHFAFPRLTQEARVNRHAGLNQLPLDVIGFKQLGTIPGGFRMKDGSYEDICPYYIEV